MSKKSPQKYIVGVDEVGRGPLAGPVTVCAFKISKGDLPSLRLIKPRDSKKLSLNARENIYKKLYKLKKDKKAIFYTSSVSNIYIDRYGIQKATQKAINNVLNRMKLKPNFVEIKLDGLLHASNRFSNQQTIIKGDDKEIVISAASIIAKVKRDKFMYRIAKKYEKYGFKEHVGYGTLAHRRAIKKYGLSKIHRKSFCKRLAKP